MSKSKTHLGRRRTSQQKTFKFEIRGFKITVKGLNSRSALNKAFRKFERFHTSKLSKLESGIGYALKAIKKAGKPQTDEQKDYLKKKRASKKFLVANPPSVHDLKLVW